MVNYVAYRRIGCSIWLHGEVEATHLPVAHQVVEPCNDLKVPPNHVSWHLAARFPSFWKT